MRTINPNKVIGLRFSRLTIESFHGYKKDGFQNVSSWNCKCDCGSVTITTIKSLRSGHTRSCGCLQKEKVIERNFKHGYATRSLKHELHTIWSNMIDRCNNPNNKSYKNYGGRGIKVCDTWLESFENFLLDMGERPYGLTLERKNNNLGYFPNNCKWATREEQNNNQRVRTDRAYYILKPVLVILLLSFVSCSVPYHHAIVYNSNGTKLKEEYDANPSIGGVHSLKGADGFSADDDNQKSLADTFQGAAGIVTAQGVTTLGVATSHDVVRSNAITHPITTTTQSVDAGTGKLLTNTVQTQQLPTFGKAVGH